MKLKSIEVEQPEINQEVLCLRGDNDYFVGRYDGLNDDGKHTFIESRECVFFDDVTDWCALPKK